MATKKLPSGLTIKIDDEKETQKAQSIKLPSGLNITPGAKTERINVTSTPMRKTTPLPNRTAGATPTTLEITQKPAKLTQRQFGIGFNTTAPAAQKTTTMPRISDQTLQKAQQLSQQTQGKTAAQLREQNTQAIKKLVELPKNETKQYGVGFGQPVVQLNENKKVSPFLPAADPQITQKAKQVAAQPGTSDTMYFLKAAKSGLGNAAAGLQNVYEIGKLSEIEKMDGEKTDFVRLGEGLSKEKNIADNIAALMNNLATNLTAAGDRKPSTIARRWLTANKIFTDENAKENGYANKEAMIDAVIDKAMQADNWNDEIQEDFAGMTESKAKGQQMAASLIQAVAQMAPTILANIVVPGSGTSVIAGQVYGNSTIDALNRGATLQQAKKRGLLSAGVEVGTEKLFGGIPGLNKGFVKLGKVGDILGEGVEEGLSTAASGAIDRATFDPDAKNATWDEIATDAALGIATAGLLNLPGGVVNIAERLTSRADVPRISAEDFANTESPVWHNVDYTNKEEQAKITTELSEKMRNEGKTVTVTQEDMAALDQYFPDLRKLKKKERLPLMKKSIADLKDYLRGVLSAYKDSSIDFTVNGNIIEAKLYNTGINEVLEKVTQDKAAMLEKSKEIFAKAEYLYSTQDKAGDTNVLRWNYFYVPLDVNGEQVGVRIAVRDMAKQNESQIYNWGIKKGTNTAIDGDGKPASPSATSVVPTQTIAQEAEEVNTEIKRPASLRQREAQQSVPSMEDRNNSAKAAIDSGASDDVVKMLETEDDGMVMDAQSDLSDVAGAIQRVKMAGWYDLPRMLDAAAKENRQLRDRLRDAIEKPLGEAKNKYSRNIINRLQQYKADMDRLGIKVGSKESAAVQWYGEKQRQTGVDGETIPYSLEQLQREFPDTWRNIVEAEKIHRQIYDEYVKLINNALAKIYPDIETRATEELGIAKADMDHALWELAMQEKLVEDLQAKAEALAAQTRSNNLVEATKAKRELAKLQKDIETETKQAGTLSEKATKAAENHQKLETKINSGEYFRGKRLMPRKDYFHHFVEMGEVGTIKGLKNMLNRPSDIAPELVGVSEFTKPKSKFSGWLQRRTGAAYTEDAVAGMARYIPMAEYKINIEPFAAQMRGTIKSVVDGTKETRNANGFIDYMTQWTNDLTGKTHKIDRIVLNEENRKAMKVLDWLNQRTAANAVVGNLASAVVQISNIPNATTYVKNPMHWWKAEADWLTGRGKALTAQSPFLTERYISNTTDLFSKKTLPRKFAEGMMEIGDREASKLIWLAAYHQYEDTGGKVKGHRQYDSAVDYADDVTRRSVGGRGIGELPPVLKSKIIKTIAPFQVEVTNSFHLLKGKMAEKDAAGLINYCIYAYLLNTIVEQITGRRVIPDIIDALKDAIKMAKGDEEEEGNIIAGIARLAGEAVSAIPAAGTFAQLFFDVEDMETIFGDQSPTKYGTGILATGPIGAALASIRRGKAPNLLELGTTYLTPYGGTQIERLVKTGQNFGVLPKLTKTDEGTRLKRQEVAGSYNNAGQLRFAMEPTAKNIATAAAFGEYATPEGRTHLEEGNTILSAAKTDIVERAQSEAKITPTVAESVIRGMTKQKTSAAKRKYLYDLKQLDTEQKAWLEHELLASDTAREKAELALTRGIPLKTFYWINANNGNGGNKETELAINRALGLTREQKEWLWSVLTNGAEKNNPYKK